LSNNHSNGSNGKISLGVDSLDIKIIRELLNNPDSSSSRLAKKLGIPLSTLQRRKTKLERSVLKKQYELNVHELGWRNAEILMLVGSGKADYVAQELIEKFDRVIGTSTRINTTTNLAAHVGFKNSEELHELMEQLRAMPNVSNLEWSEIVGEVGNRGHRLAHLIYNSS
jgi:DNA-binding Lrp family transcriptional regulator